MIDLTACIEVGDGLGTHSLAPARCDQFYCNARVLVAQCRLDHGAAEVLLRDDQIGPKLTVGIDGRARPLLRSTTQRFVFDDPLALLAACEEHGLEGIVSKLREDRYRSGKNAGWIKVKTAAWRAANRERHKLFEKRD